MTEFSIDDFIIRSSKIWAKPSAPQESTIALKQWTLDHANLAREQTEYLHNERDLLSWAASGDDSTMGWLQPRAEKALIWLYGLLKKVRKCTFGIYCSHCSGGCKA